MSAQVAVYVHSVNDTQVFLGQIPVGYHKRINHKDKAVECRLYE